MIIISCLQGLLEGWKFRNTDAPCLQTDADHHIARAMKITRTKRFSLHLHDQHSGLQFDDIFIM